MLFAVQKSQMVSCQNGYIRCRAQANDDGRLTTKCIAILRWSVSLAEFIVFVLICYFFGKLNVIVVNCCS